MESVGAKRRAIVRAAAILGGKRAVAGGRAPRYITIRTSPAFHAKVKIAAARCGMSISAYGTKVLGDALRRRTGIEQGG